MHNLTKIKVFRVLLCITYPVSLLLLLPFALLKKKNPSGIFFFLDRYTMGGAQRVHLDILASISNVYKQVYFTRLSPNDRFKEEFYNTPNSTCTDIHFYCDNLLIRLFTVHYYVFYINRHKGAHVFSSNSTFFYDMLPFISGRVTKTELLHNFTFGNNGMEFFGLANYKYLDNRLLIDLNTAFDIKKQYEQYNVPEVYAKRLSVIENAVIVPEERPQKSFELPLKVFYAGRGGPQKRINLLNKIAEILIQKNAPVAFHLGGTIMDELSPMVKERSILYGTIGSHEEMYRIYRQSHVIIMTSAYEGFPLFVKEGMANGCVPVVTALQGNKVHLKHNENALLIDQPENEQYVVERGVALLEELIADNTKLSRLSANAYTYAVQHFDVKEFMKKYHAFFIDGTRYPVF